MLSQPGALKSNSKEENKNPTFWSIGTLRFARANQDVDVSGGGKRSRQPSLTLPTPLSESRNWPAPPGIPRAG